MTINIFKKAVLLQIFLFLSGFILVILEVAYFPYEEVDNDILTTDMSMSGSIGFIFFLFLIVILPLMWYFLYKLKPLGKKLFIFYVILGFVAYFVMSDDEFLVKDVNPLTRWSELIFHLMILLDGVILTFLFFTDVKEEFK